MGRIFFTFLLAIVAVGAIAWYFELIPSDPATDVRGVGKAIQVTSADKLGEWLYPRAAELAKEPWHQLKGGHDPIVIQGHLSEIDKIDVPTRLGGRILYVGDGLPEGVTQIAGIAPFMVSEYKQASVKHKGRDLTRFYKPFQRGSEVLAGQTIAEIDYAQALYAVLQHHTLLEKAEAELVAAQKLDLEAENRLQIELRAGSSSSEREKSDARLTRVRTIQELIKATKEIDKELIELENANLNLTDHRIFSKRLMRRAFIKTIYRDTGEAVKEYEPILQLYSIDRLMAEAFVEIQYLDWLKPEPGKTRYATIEPTVEQKPLRRFEGHRKYPINGVCFVQQGKMLFVVSGSDDGYVKIWHQNAVGPVEDFDLREPVKAMACSPAGVTQNLCLAGTGEGMIHVLKLFPDNEVKPCRACEPFVAHSDGITALAFSLDGAYFASGAADGSIKIWRTEDRKEMYAFDAEHGVDSPHQGAITSLHFTPHARLVSAGRDGSLRVWNLKENGAHLQGTPHAGRSGNVHQLGVSRDGRFMLLDQGKSLQLLSVADGRMIDSVRNLGGATPFETLALFAPDGNLLLTGGAAEGKLQLWRTPSKDSRAFEVRQYVTDERAAPTCATFAPGSNFIASGSKDGFVYLWPVPDKDAVDNHRRTNVPVRMIGNNVEAGSRQVRIGIEVPNEDGRLTPGRPVTIVFE